MAQRTILPNVALVLLMGFLSPSEPTSPGKPEEGGSFSAVSLEVEVERIGEIDRTTVFIRNDRAEPVSFETGARGGDGSLNDRKRRNLVGQAPRVLPELTFELENDEASGFITLRPPALSGLPRRSMAAAKFVAPPGTRLQYASFAVPHAHVSGKLVHARMQVDAGVALTGTLLIEKRPAGK